MKDLDLRAVVEIRSLNFAALTSLVHYDSGKPRHLMQVSTDPIFIKALKKGQKTGLEALGIKFMT
jgi:hypothetical protein